MRKYNHIILSCVILFINHEVLSDPVPAANSALIGNKAYEKCVEYSNLAYGADSKLNDGKPIKCGQRNRRPNIYVENANAKEFPSLVLLGYSKADNESSDIRYLCSGTLISDDFVLTAAHCIAPYSYILKKVRVGELDYDDVNDDAKPQDYEVDVKIAHPDNKKDKMYNDIGLVRLNKKVTLSSYVLPACLNWKPDIEEKQAILIGWGSAEARGEIHKHLQNVHLDIFDHEECNTAYESYLKGLLVKGIDNESQVCAGHHGEGNEMGAGSGPLQVYQNEDIDCMYSVVGVASLGALGYNYHKIPAVYTRVSHYVKWIESIVWP